MFTRQIGKILRGKATPLHLMLAAILGSMLGFVPGFWEGPGLIVALTILLIVFNANLAAAGIIGLVAKIVSYPLLPVSFAVGQLLLDGPAQPLFKWMVNAPGLALFGLEHYLTTGAAVVGLVFGVICGLIVIKLVTAFRRKMVSLEENSEAFVRYTSKGWVKLLTFVFVGGRKGKLTYAQLAEKKFGNPIRISGAIAAVLLIALVVVFQSFFSEQILTAYLREGLEQANGATVDLGKVEVDLRGGRMTIDQIAMADANALETDILRAEKVEADISANDLLRKRARLDRVVVSNATSGEKRATPGRPIRGAAPLPLPPEQGEGKTIDDYINDAKIWKDRLAQAREWLEKISGSDDQQTPQEREETAKERIARQIRESGYASVVATHLIENVPTLVVTELVADGVKTAKVEGEVFDVRGEHLSTHPNLLAQKPKISIKSRSDKIALLADFAAPAPGAKGDQLRFKYLGLPTDSISKSLAIGGNASPISGGTMDVRLNGDWSSGGVGHVDLPLRITLHDATITLPKAGASNVKELNLALGLRGPIDNPRIHVDDKQLADALAKAGATALADHVRGEADKKLQEAQQRATEKIGGEIDKAIGDKAKDALGKLVPGSN